MNTTLAIMRVFLFLQKMQLLKTDNTHKTISFCVLTPDIMDRNGDIISEDEITKTAHDFMQNISEKYINIDHEDGTNIDKSKYSFVENFIAPTDIIVGENIVKK